MRNCFRRSKAGSNKRQSGGDDNMALAYSRKRRSNLNGCRLRYNNRSVAPQRLEDAGRPQGGSGRVREWREGSVRYVPSVPRHSFQQS